MEMKKKKIGGQTVKLEHPPKIISTHSIVGPKEGEGPLSSYFDVILNDDIPASIINPEYSLDGGASFQPWNGSLNIGTLNSGISLTVLIQGTVSLNSSEYIVNTATVSSTTPDPDLSNNISTIITPVNHKQVFLL